MTNSDKLDKKSEPYDIVDTVEKVSPRSRLLERKKKFIGCACVILGGILVLACLIALIKHKKNNCIITIETIDESRLLAFQTVHDAQSIMEAVRQGNALISARNKIDATMYINGMQDVLRKRVQKRVKTITKLVLERVQDIENQLAVFERVISTAVEGNLDFTKINIDKIKSYLDTSAPNTISVPMLNDAIGKVEKNITSFSHDLEQMFTFYGRYIDDIVRHKTEDITDRIRVILTTDRKLFRNVAALQISICYKIARQNYDISGNLERVFDALNKLRRATDSINMLTSLHRRDTSIVEAINSLDTALYEAEHEFYGMMNTDYNFLGTVLKELAYEDHLEMKDYIFQSYETAIRSLVPALTKVCRNFQVVKKDHWQLITEVLTPLLADVSKLIQTKVQLLEGNSRKQVSNSEFVSEFTLVEDTFKNVLAKVNPLFETKQGQMLDGLKMTLDFTIAEQLPLISTWSLKNYLPADACPMSVDFQTYLKGTIDRYLLQSLNLQVIPGVLQQALELDAEFKPANDDSSTIKDPDQKLVN